MERMSWGWTNQTATAAAPKPMSTFGLRQWRSMLSTPWSLVSFVPSATFASSGLLSSHYVA